MTIELEAKLLTEQAEKIADLKMDFSSPKHEYRMKYMTIEIDVLREVIRKYEAERVRAAKAEAELSSQKAPLTPNRRAEWELEMEVFNMINNTPHPQRADVVNLLQKLWREVCAREAWLTEYVIYSPNEFATSNERGFWNQDKFTWDIIDNATSLREIPEIFPPSVGNDARIVLKRQAAEHIG